MCFFRSAPARTSHAGSDDYYNDGDEAEPVYYVHMESKADDVYGAIMDIIASEQAALPSSPAVWICSDSV